MLFVAVCRWDVWPGWGECLLVRCLHVSGWWQMVIQANLDGTMQTQSASGTLKPGGTLSAPQFDKFNTDLTCTIPDSRNPSGTSVEASARMPVGPGCFGVYATRATPPDTMTTLRIGRPLPVHNYAADAVGGCRFSLLPAQRRHYRRRYDWHRQS